MKPIRKIHVYKAAAVAVIAITAVAASNVYAQVKVLTDNSGMTVYTFDKDGTGKSTCYGSCAAAWPPVPTGGMPSGAEFASISREDGIQQAAYKGRPLYRFVGDRKPGDANGDKLQNAWHVVAPGNKQIETNSRQIGYGSGGPNAY
jgi:predicted lipoprotein with Yx(FWY)xxD motif